MIIRALIRSVCLAGLLFPFLSPSVTQAETIDTEMVHRAENEIIELAHSKLRSVSPGREIHLYHWAFASEALGEDTHLPISPDDYRVEHYLNYLRSLFDSPSSETIARGGMAGPGIYAATDPVASCSYGGCFAIADRVGFMVQFALEPGVKFLNLQFDIPLSPGLQSRLSNTGCPAYSLLSIFLNDGCRYFRDRIVESTGAVALAFLWEENLLFPACHRRGVSFVLFGNSLPVWNRTVTFTAEIPPRDDGHQENRRLIESLIENFTNPNDRWTRQPRLPLWPSLAGQPPLTVDTETWMRQNIYGCGNWPEDQ